MDRVSFLRMPLCSLGARALRAGAIVELLEARCQNFSWLGRGFLHHSVVLTVAVVRFHFVHCHFSFLTLTFEEIENTKTPKFWLSAKAIISINTPQSNGTS